MRDVLLQRDIENHLNYYSPKNLKPLKKQRIENYGGRAALAEEDLRIFLSSSEIPLNLSSDIILISLSSLVIEETESEGLTYLI